jgi:hypothetical protein
MPEQNQGRSEPEHPGKVFDVMFISNRHTPEILQTASRFFTSVDIASADVYPESNSFGSDDVEE